LLAISQPDLDQDLYSLATQASAMLDKMHPGGKIIEGVIMMVFFYVKIMFVIVLLYLFSRAYVCTLPI